MGVFKHDMVLLRGGDVRLYKRDDHEDPKWQVQFRVDGEERTLRRTTGLYDLDEAKRKALDMYDEFKFRKKYDIPVFEKTVAGVAKEFLKEQQKLVKIGQLTNSMYRIYKKSLRYWSEMLPNQNINKLHETDLTQYLEWRANYYVTGPGKDLKGNRAGVKGKPADGTLQHEVMSTTSDVARQWPRSPG